MNSSAVRRRRSPLPSKEPLDCARDGNSGNPDALGFSAADARSTRAVVLHCLGDPDRSGGSVEPPLEIVMVFFDLLLGQEILENWFLISKAPTVLGAEIIVLKIKILMFI